MEETEVLEQIENAEKNDLNYFEILGTDRYSDSQDTFPKEYFEYRKEWRERPLRNNPGKFPLHVDFEATNRCNLRCTMCQIDFDTMKAGDMDLTLYERVLEECSDNGLPSVKLNYRGEPLLNSNLPNMIALAKEAGVMEVQLNTNGVLLNEKLSDALIDAGLDRIKVSIDGATREVYERLRGVRYEKAVGNVKKLVERRDGKGKPRPIIHVQMVHMQDNKDEIVKYVLLWKDIVNRIGFSRYRSSKRILEDQRRVTQNPTATVPCSQLWQRLLITFDGQVLMCCGDHKALNPLGDIQKMSLREIWQSDLLEQYRLLHLENRSNQIPACSICEINRTDPKTARMLWGEINKNVRI